MDKQVKIEIKTVQIWYKGYPVILAKDVADVNNIKSGFEICSEEEFLRLVGVNTYYFIEKIKLFKNISLN